MTKEILTYKIYFHEEEINETAKKLPILELPFPPQLFNNMNKEKSEDIINMIKREIVPLLPRDPIMNNPERDAVMALLQKINDNEFQIINNQTNQIAYVGKNPSEDFNKFNIEDKYIENNSDVNKLSVLEIIKERKQIKSRMILLDGRLEVEINKEIDLLVSQVNKLNKLKEIWLEISRKNNIGDIITIEAVEELLLINENLKNINFSST